MKTKSKIAGKLIRQGIRTGRSCISFQVVQECLNVIARHAEIALTAEQAKRYLDTSLKPLWRIYPSTSLYQRALDIQALHQFSFYDSLIIAAAQEAGVRFFTAKTCNTGNGSIF